jgi:hypothetical protein
MSMNNIILKNIIVGEVNNTYCGSVGCDAPTITVEADKQYKSRLETLGFVTTDDPTIPIDTSIINIDVSTKGLFYTEDRTTKLINYEITNKTEKTNCGDGVCQTREKYLYELDIFEHCSMLDNISINYKHCPLDCKDKLDANLAITRDDFKLLKIKCINKIETKPVEKPKDDVTMPVAPKAIELMTQAEKNEFIAKLQIMLVDLLKQLLALMKK